MWNFSTPAVDQAFERFLFGDDLVMKIEALVGKATPLATEDQPANPISFTEPEVFHLETATAVKHEEPPKKNRQETEDHHPTAFKPSPTCSDDSRENLENEEFDRLFLEEFGPPPPPPSNQTTVREPVFAFVARYELQQKMRKEELARKATEDEAERRRASVFKALSMPKTSRLNAGKDDEFERLFVGEFGPPPTVRRTIPEPFGFVVRHQMQQEIRKQELARKAMEDEAERKRLSVFKARPMPRSHPKPSRSQQERQAPKAEKLVKKFNLREKQHRVISSARQLPKENPLPLQPPQDSTNTIISEPLRLIQLTSSGSPKKVAPFVADCCHMPVTAE